MTTRKRTLYLALHNVVDDIWFESFDKAEAEAYIAEHDDLYLGSIELTFLA